jgi:DNA-binding cell septation regulator SpoVG
LINNKKGEVMSQLSECKVVSVRPVDNAGKLKALVDLRVGGALIIHCAIYDGKNGRFASMPQRVSADGKWRKQVFVADDDLKRKYEETMLKAYEEEIKGN